MYKLFYSVDYLGWVCNGVVISTRDLSGKTCRVQTHLQATVVCLAKLARTDPLGKVPKLAESKTIIDFISCDCVSCENRANTPI